MSSSFLGHFLMLVLHFSILVHITMQYLQAAFGLYFTNISTSSHSFAFYLPLPIEILLLRFFHCQGQSEIETLNEQ